jgi:hypothetical protein
MTKSFLDAGYDCVFGDLMFGLGIPVSIHSERGLKTLAALLMPIAGRLPFEWVYPTGEKQEKRTPKWSQYYEWAAVIAGDCHYIKRTCPTTEGKIIVTTPPRRRRRSFRSAGVKYLVTSTPALKAAFRHQYDGSRSGSLAGKGRRYRGAELAAGPAGFEPQLQELN